MMHLSDTELNRRTEAWAIRCYEFIGTAFYHFPGIIVLATQCDIDAIDREFYTEGGGDA